MTRINLVNPSDLADQHLFAEWREIKMIAPAANRSLKTRPVSEIVKGISKEYTLNAGHVTFFYDKLTFLYHRFTELTHELIQRGYDIEQFNFCTPIYREVESKIPQRSWLPTQKDTQVNIDRIVQRLNERPTWYRYYGDVYAPDFFIDRYNQQLLVDTIAA